MSSQSQEMLTLSNLCDGEVEEEFQALYPAIVSQLRESDVGGITINIKLKRVTDTGTMLHVSASVTPKFPAKARAAVVQQTTDCKLQVNKPREKVVQIELFQGGKKTE